MRKIMRRAVRVALYICLVQCAVWGRQRPAVSPISNPRYDVPDAIFYNGKVVTVDPQFRIQHAFAVLDGKFLAIGDTAAIRALAGPKTRLIDLQGRTVLPGLIDNHNHQYRAAITLFRGVYLANAPSLSEMLARLRKAVASAKPGEAVLGGAGWDPGSFPEKRAPTRQELDRVSANQAIVVLLTRGQAFLNSSALSSLGLATPGGKQAGITVRKDSSGQLTGEVDGSGNSLLTFFEKLIPPSTDAEKAELILKAQQQQNSVGLTGIRELELAPEIMRIYWNLERQGKLTIRVSMGIEAQPSDADRLEEMLKPWGVGPGFGDDWLRLDSVAEFGLGDVFREPYANRPGYSGELGITPEKLTEAMLVIDRYGWRPAIHIQGDKTLDYVLDAYEAADRQSSIHDKRWLVEHIPQVHPDQMDRIARLGVLISTQTRPYSKAKELVDTLGKERAEQQDPMRTLTNHHLTVTSGSDWPARTNNPFVNIYYYVTRNTVDEGPLGLSEKLSREEAIRAATINNAYLTFEENRKGSIEQGKLADFVILSDDILTLPEEKIKSILPLATYVGGQMVFHNPTSGF